MNDDEALKVILYNLKNDKDGSYFIKLAEKIIEYEKEKQNEKHR